MSKTKASPTKTFSNTPTGREQAYQQAKKQGEKSVTFVIPATPTTKKKGASDFLVDGQDENGRPDSSPFGFSGVRGRSLELASFEGLDAVQNCIGMQYPAILSVSNRPRAAIADFPR